MFGIETLPANVQAVVLVGLVLVEALVLHVGYSGLFAVLGPVVERVVGGESA